MDTNNYGKLIYREYYSSTENVLNNKKDEVSHKFHMKYSKNCSKNIHTLDFNIIFLVVFHFPLSRNIFVYITQYLMISLSIF